MKVSLQCGDAAGPVASLQRKRMMLAHDEHVVLIERRVRHRRSARDPGVQWFWKQVTQLISEVYRERA
ncbi:hypothetical protein [Paraburkholderia xenovorans]|uniref:hypothetical protein n=1 Tax=Paraburkholderia xenovorans TaxID=36873 RepID=UPI0038BAE772